MTLPSFIIIGAQKCGTTSLYNYMIEHPQILPASMKELHFFNWRSKQEDTKTVDWYLSQFPTIPHGKNLITGEATPDYLIDPHTPQRMFNLLPDVKLIVLLRNPIDRAVSHYHHNRGISKKREPLPFRKAIEKEPERLNIEKEKLISDENYRSLFHRNYSYLERGIYIEQLENWMSIFPREQFLIIKSEDFYANPNITLKEVFEFLGLPNHQVKNNRKYNERSYQPIDEKMRSTLAEYFQPYNQRLEEYLGVKFNWAMSPYPEPNPAHNLQQKQHISLSNLACKLDNYQSQLEKIKSSNESSKTKSNNSIVFNRRSDRLNQLATINQSSKYLEIGVSGGITFNAINIKNKVAVDPKFRFNTKEYATENVVFLEVTSDEFFRNHAHYFQRFDLIYLDGLHTFEQTFRDFCASVSLSHPKTIWLIDDTCPGSYAQAQSSLKYCNKLKRIYQEKGGAWMGDVFKVVAAMHDFFPQFSFATFPEHGQTVVWNEWRKDFQPLWNSLEAISRLKYLDFLELQETLFKREPYKKIFDKVKYALNSSS
ncbi:sulfotransferase domain-containing protein [Dapis sp. BLCC M172]|uniref:sulfotransferase domain-containing protein n=1 Tax=Dapis sp. BLCC M172 TaxID=2975281 RepID=UPI003CF6C243